MGLELEGPPDPANGRLGQTRAFGHLRPRPVRGIGWCRLQGRHHHILDLVGTDHRRPAGPVLVGQAVESVFDEPAAPLADRGRRATQLRSDRLVVQAVRTPQHDPGTQRQCLRELPRTRPADQLAREWRGAVRVAAIWQPSCPRNTLVRPTASDARRSPDQAKRRRTAGSRHPSSGPLIRGLWVRVPRGPPDGVCPAPSEVCGARYPRNLNVTCGCRFERGGARQQSHAEPDAEVAQRSAWNIQRCFSSAAVTVMSMSWLTTSASSVSLMPSRRRAITVFSATTK